jgi:hypothetical protein
MAVPEAVPDCGGWNRNRIEGIKRLAELDLRKIEFLPLWAMNQCAAL